MTLLFYIWSCEWFCFLTAELVSDYITLQLILWVTVFLQLSVWESGCFLTLSNSWSVSDNALLQLIITKLIVQNFPPKIKEERIHRHMTSTTADKTFHGISPSDLSRLIYVSYSRGFLAKRSRLLRLGYCGSQNVCPSWAERNEIGVFNLLVLLLPLFFKGDSVLFLSSFWFPLLLPCLLLVTLIVNCVLFFLVLSLTPFKKMVFCLSLLLFPCSSSLFIAYFS